MFQNLVKLRQNVAFDVNYIPINVTFLFLHYHIAILGYIHTGIKELFRIIQQESHTTEFVSEILCYLILGTVIPRFTRFSITRFSITRFFVIVQKNLYNTVL